MRLLRILPERWRNLLREATSFAIIGVINTAVDFLILNLLLPIGPLKAKVVATVVATTTSYAMNRYWTFSKRERTSARREYVLFFALNLVGLAIQLVILAVPKYGLHYSETGGTSDRIAFNLANAIGTGIAMVFRFWAYRTFVFKAPAPVAPTAPALAPAGTVTEAATANEAPTANEAVTANEAAADALDERFAELTAPLECELDESRPRNGSGPNGARHPVADPSLVPDERHYRS